jgi:hypothetical protein
MTAKFKFSLGDIYQAKFRFEEDDRRYKERAVFVWHLHNDGQTVLSSKITGSIGRSDWELVLQLGLQSGLTKTCVVRVDQTIYLPITFFIYPRGILNVFEITAIKELYMKYLNR